MSLALALARSPLKELSVLIVEPEARTKNDRTWCFWTDAPSPLDPVARRQWTRLAFHSNTLSREWDLAPFRYLMLRGLDFYTYAHAELARHNVTFLRGSGEVLDGEACATLQVDGREFTAQWVFDSRIRPMDLLSHPRGNTLKQHFLGWEVETERPVFDPQTVTMFDLRTPQRGGVTFFYTLPFSATNALVEYTLFSRETLPLEEYETALRSHLAQHGAGAYRLIEVERGVIPMTDRPFPRRLGRRILAIGTRGGRVKPSTGYAFARIQRDSERIVASLLLRGHPFTIPPDKLRHRLHDSVMLEILAREPDLGRPIFSSIFSRNPVQRVLRFLDDRSTLGEDLSIMAAHEPGPFLRAIARRYLLPHPPQSPTNLSPPGVPHG